MPKRYWILLGTGLASFLICLDFTIVNTSLANIQKDLNASIGALSWVMAALGLIFSASLVVMGRLGDLMGHKRLIVIGIVGFALASLGAGLAQNVELLIIMRFLQGVFGAPTIPCAMAIVASVFSDKESGRALGLLNSLLGIGLASGPVVGGLIDTYLDWRWIFLVNVPFCIAGLIITLIFVPNESSTKKIKIDWLGAIILSLSLAALTFGIIQGPTYGWTSESVLGAFLIALLGFIALIWVEKKASTPILPVHLFKNPGFILGLSTYCSGTALCWPVLFFMPLYLHQVLGYSTENSAFLLFIMTLMTMIGPTIAGNLYDKGHKAFTINSVLIGSIIGMILFYSLSLSGPLYIVILGFIIFGIAWGFSNGISVPVALIFVDSKTDVGVVSGALLTIMNTLGMLLMSSAGSIFRIKQQNLFSGNAMVQNITQGHETIASLLKEPDKYYELLAKLPAAMGQQLSHLYQVSFVAGIRTAYLYLLGFSILCAVISWLVIKPVLKAHTN